jgi:hypothetical protein
MKRISFLATLVALQLLLAATLDGQAGGSDDRVPGELVPITAAPSHLDLAAARSFTLVGGESPARRMSPLGTALIGAAGGALVGAAGAYWFASGGHAEDMRLIVIYVTVPAGALAGGLVGLIYGLTRD